MAAQAHTHTYTHTHTHTQMQTHAVSSFRGSKKAEPQKYHSVTWINDPISQLEVHGLLFPNRRALKSVGILIAETCPLPLARLDRGNTGRRRERLEWCLNIWRGWCDVGLWASLSASGRRNQQRLRWRSEGEKTCLFIFDHSLFFLSLRLSVSPFLSDSFIFLFSPLSFLSSFYVCKACPHWCRYFGIFTNAFQSDDFPKLWFLCICRHQTQQQQHCYIRVHLRLGSTAHSYYKSLVKFVITAQHSQASASPHLLLGSIDCISWIPAFLSSISWTVDLDFIDIRHLLARHACLSFWSCF